MRAWEVHEQGWSQRAIAEALGVTPGAVSQWLSRARRGGVPALRRQRVAGRPTKLTAEHRATLPGLLAPGAEAFGFRGQVWTAKRVAAAIHRMFGVTYHPAHVSRLLHQLGLSVQPPVRRASQRDEAALRRWHDERWPALKKKPATKDAPSAG